MASGHANDPKALEVSVIDKKVIFPKQHALVGKVVIDLNPVLTSKAEICDWYFLVK